MAANDVVLLAAFGEKDFFRKAYNYDLTEIRDWLDKCAAGQKGRPRTEDKDVQKKLLEIKKNLYNLILPDGSQFINKELIPKSHIDRTMPNKKWRDVPVDPNNRDLPVAFKVKPCEIEHKGAPNQTLKSKWADPYNLLGLFISTLGPAPDGADRNNYFLPLTAVYGRWCSRIAGHAPKNGEWPYTGDGEGDWPYMFQITWKPINDEEKIFFLGSSTAGDNWDENPKTKDGEENPNYTGRWRRAVQRSRFEWLHSGLQIKVFTLDYFDKLVDDKKKARTPGYTYGNCAETYPFIFSVHSSPGENKKLMGLALCRTFIMESSKVYDHKIVSANIYNPCANCKKLITGTGAILVNFSRKKGAGSGKPKKIIAEKVKTATSKMSADNDPPPEGWSNSGDDLDIEYYWGPDGEGTIAAQKVGLTGLKGLMVVDRDNGRDAYMFTASTGKVYLWNMVSDEIYEYTNPSDLTGIVAQMRMPPGKGKVERKLLFGDD